MLYKVKGFKKPIPLGEDFEPISPKMEKEENELIKQILKELRVKKFEQIYKDLYDSATAEQREILENLVKANGIQDGITSYYAYYYYNTKYGWDLKKVVNLFTNFSFKLKNGKEEK